VRVDAVFRGEQRLGEELAAIDREIAGFGEACDTTGIVVCVLDGRIIGASVGDSEAWLFTGTAPPMELTARQKHRPRIGSSCWPPVEFEAEFPAGARFLMGSDGVLGWSLQRQQVRAIAEAAGSAAALLDALHAAVLSNYASYPDDFGAVAILRS